MRISLFSFFMAVSWSSLFVTLIYICRKKLILMSFYSVPGLLQLIVITMFRMILPVELPFTRIVASRVVYTSIVKFINQPVYLLSDHFTVGGLLITFWCLSVIILILRLACHYTFSKKKIFIFSEAADYRFIKLLGEIRQKNNTKLMADIRISSSIEIPLSFGLLKKYILLPKREYEEKELYYILLHEYTHLVNGDLEVKFMICILCCIFWWNPFIYLLKKELEQTLENKCDLTIARELGQKEQAEYLSAIVETIKQLGKKFGKRDEKTDFLTGSVSLATRRAIEIKERFELVYRYGDKRAEFKGRLVMAVCFSLLFVLSYTVIIQSEFEPPLEEIEEGNDTYKIDIDEVILDNNGRYKITLPNGEIISLSDEDTQKMKELGLEVNND